uniref:Uncharacterized protein n=1 Tax=Caenorhabditis japonica TaxID=281687 RepID=A0A8R1EV67_CAEJA
MLDFTGRKGLLGPQRDAEEACPALNKGRQISSAATLVKVVSGRVRVTRRLAVLASRLVTVTRLLAAAARMCADDGQRQPCPYQKAPSEFLNW